MEETQPAVGAPDPGRRIASPETHDRAAEYAYPVIARRLVRVYEKLGGVSS